MVNREVGCGGVRMFLRSITQDNTGQTKLVAVVIVNMLHMLPCGQQGGWGVGGENLFEE